MLSSLFLSLRCLRAITIPSQQQQWNLVDHPIITLCYPLIDLVVVLAVSISVVPALDHSLAALIAVPFVLGTESKVVNAKILSATSSVLHVRKRKKLRNSTLALDQNLNSLLEPINVQIMFKIFLFEYKTFIYVSLLRNARIL
jgi:hypothetical protein